jgi:uncharacterized protein YecE (DUF72 family)
MEIKVGCCGFPGGMKAYFKKFPLVEVQRTFYSLPRIETALRWRKIAPVEFEFALKAWQLITHPPRSPTYRKAGIKVSKPENYGFFRPTREVFEAWDKTLEISLALKAKAVVLQCPASFKATEENISNMRDFFNSIERKKLLFAWEPRGAWDEALIRELCEEFKLVHCVDPFMGEPAIQREIAYLRLHGYEGGRMYYHEYTQAELETLLDKCLNLGCVKAYCLFNNIKMLKNATEFQELVKSQAPGGLA